MITCSRTLLLGLAALSWLVACDQEPVEPGSAEPTPALALPQDLDGDPDGDGIPTPWELAAGTDPRDPSSAAAWHPEIHGHPRLFLGPEQVAAVAARVELEDGAHPVLWARLLSQAARTPPEQPTDGTYVPETASARGQIAEAAAFVALLTQDATLAEKAAEILAAPMPDPTYLNRESPFDVGAHYDLLEAEALVAHCTAYDWLAGNELVEHQALEAARSRLTERIDFYRHICFDAAGGCRTLLRNERNNHTLKALGALGLCAVAVPDRPEAAADFSEAVAGLEYLLTDYQGEAEGGYAEGWNYLVYGASSYLQVLYALHRLAPAGQWAVRPSGSIVPDDPLVGQVRWIDDFAEQPTTRGLFQGMLKATQPDGRTPPIDDANPSAMPGGLLAALFDDPRFLWNWQQPRVNYAAPGVLSASFAAHDAQVEPLAPDWPLDLFLPSAGFSVLRSGWDADQLYVYVVHEQGRMRANGYSHEHADNLSFVMHSFGEPLIIDPGYITWTEHHRVRYGHDHNLVLVDGDGPPFPAIDLIADTSPTSDAVLHDWESEGQFTTLVGSSRYQGAVLARRFLRVGDRMLVVADRLQDEAQQERDWTWQLNGYAGGTVPNSQYAPTDLGGSWQRAGASVQAAVQSTLGDITWQDTLEDCQLGDGWRQHVRLAAQASMGTGAGFLSVVAPSQPESAALAFSTVQTAPGVAVLIVEDAPPALVALNLTGTASSVTWQEQVLSLPPGLSWFEGGALIADWPMDTPALPEEEMPSP